MDTLEAIKARKSYRGKYNGTPVPREDLVKIMEAGLAAPSGCNKQTTSLIAVDDKETLKRIFEATGLTLGKDAPAAIFVLTQDIASYNSNSYNVQDYSAAIENMLLACVSLGYQSCWVEGYVKDTGENSRIIAELLNVPDEYEVICFLPVGTADEPVKSVRKKEFSQRAWFNSFGCGK